MESISSEKLPLIRHTLDKLSLAIDRLQERTAVTFFKKNYDNTD